MDCLGSNDWSCWRNSSPSWSLITRRFWRKLRHQFNLSISCPSLHSLPSFPVVSCSNLMVFTLLTVFTYDILGWLIAFCSVSRHAWLSQDILFCLKTCMTVSWHSVLSQDMHDCLMTFLSVSWHSWLSNDILYCLMSFLSD